MLELDIGELVSSAVYLKGFISDDHQDSLALVNDDSKKIFLDACARIYVYVENVI
jgi:hypothetical protein